MPPCLWVGKGRSTCHVKPCRSPCSREYQPLLWAVGTRASPGWMEEGWNKRDRAKDKINNI